MRQNHWLWPPGVGDGCKALSRTAAADRLGMQQNICSTGSEKCCECGNWLAAGWRHLLDLQAFLKKSSYQVNQCMCLVLWKSKLTHQSSEESEGTLVQPGCCKDLDSRGYVTVTLRGRVLLLFFFSWKGRNCLILSPENTSVTPERQIPLKSLI